MFVTEKGTSATVVDGGSDYTWVTGSLLDPATGDPDLSLGDALDGDCSACSLL